MSLSMTLEETLFETEPAAEPGERYVDLYLLPVPDHNIDAYRRQAETFGLVARELGALSYSEFLGDDLDTGFEAPFGETIVVALVEFRSREHRDEVMAQVMLDPRIRQLMQAEQFADMRRLSYGGFAPLVTV